MEQISLPIDTPNLFDLVAADASGRVEALAVDASAVFAAQDGIPPTLSATEDGNPEWCPTLSVCEDSVEPGSKP